MFKNQNLLTSFLVMLLFFTVFVAYGQNVAVNKKLAIKGIIVEPAENRPLAAATIVLQKQDGVPVKTAITSLDGLFEFEVADKAKYIIKVSYMGLADFVSDVINIDKESVDLGRVVMNYAEEVLEGVTITASRKKPLIQNKGDRMVYNAGSDISNKAGNATDVMRKAPMLTVGADGEVKMRGNSNIKVLLNGMPSGILAKNLKEALKMIPASSIESIEVITNPSAKYEAEGAAGVINIVTKKKMKGTSGSLDLSGGNLDQSGNLALNMATGKFNFSLMANASHDQKRNISILDRNSLLDGQTIGNLYQRGDATQRNKGAYGSFTTEYRIDSLQKIEAGVSYWKGMWPQKSDLYNRYLGNTGNTEYNQKRDQEGTYTYYELSLNYQKKFKKEGQEFQLIGQASRSDDKSEYITNQYLMNGAHSFREQSPNVGNGKDWSLQADYAHPLDKSGKSTIETGAKYLGSNSKSDYKVFNSQNPVDASRSDIMSYYQNIFSSYISANLKTESGWGFRPGLRFEYTKLGGDFQNNTPSFGSSYSNWVPSMLITRKLNDQQEMKLNYTERVRRPWIWDLNPYVNASDPNNITAGNPNLKPELTRMLELGHAYNAASGFSLNSSVYFNSNSNAVESITTVDGSGISYTTSQNIAANKRLGTNINASLQVGPKWTLNTGGELFYLKFKSKSMNMQNEGVFYTVNLNSSYTLPKDFSILISGDYGNGYVTLQGENSANYSYRFAARKEIFNKKASLTLTTNNPFQKTFMQKSSATAPTFQSNSTSRFYNRSVSLSFSWQFGGLRESDYSGKKFSGQDDNKPARRN